MSKNFDVDVILTKDNSYIVKAYQEKVNEAVGRQYAMARRNKGLTQEELSILSGIKRPNIARFENGHHSPSLDMLAKMAGSMGMALEIRLVEK